MTTMRFSAVTLALLFVSTLTACGEGDTEPNESAPTVTVTASPSDQPSESASEEPTGPVPPNVGANSLRVGEAREGLAFVTTVLETKIPHPPGEYRVPKDGQMFGAFLLKQCLKKSATDLTPDEAMTTSSIDWAFVERANSYTGGSGWDDWPAPRFPEMQQLLPGDCRRGWVTIEMPQGVKPTKLSWIPQGYATADWTLD